MGPKMWGKEMGKWLAEDTTVRSFDFMLGTTTAALRKDIRFISERHLSTLH